MHPTGLQQGSGGPQQGLDASYWSPTRVRCNLLVPRCIILVLNMGQVVPHKGQMHPTGPRCIILVLNMGQVVPNKGQMHPAGPQQGSGGPQQGLDASYWSPTGVRCILLVSNKGQVIPNKG